MFVIVFRVLRNKSSQKNIASAISTHFEKGYRFFHLPTNVIKITEDEGSRNVKPTSNNVFSILPNKSLTFLYREIFPHTFLIISKLYDQRNLKRVLQISTTEITINHNQTKTESNFLGNQTEIKMKRKRTHLVNIKGMICPKCRASEDGPRPV